MSLMPPPLNSGRGGSVAATPFCFAPMD